MSDRIAVMTAGRIQEIGTPRELYECPKNHFTAQFLGQMNFLPARVGETRSDLATSHRRGTLVRSPSQQTACATWPERAFASASGQRT